MPSSQSGYGAPKGTPAQGSGGNALSFRPASATQEVNEEKKKLAPSPIKSYQEIGKGARDVLYGNKAEGLFAFGASKLSLASMTSANVSLSSAATRSEAGTMSGLVSVALPSVNGWLVDGSISSTGSTEVMVMGMPPRLYPFRVNASAVWPPAASRPSAKVGMDYMGLNMHAKLTSTAEPKPLFTASAVAGAGRVALAGELVFDTRASVAPPGKGTRWGAVTRWGGAATWIDGQQTVAASLAANTTAETLTGTLSYSYALDSATSLGVEATHSAKRISTPAPAGWMDGGGVGVDPTEAAAGAGGGGAMCTSYQASAPRLAMGMSWKLSPRNGGAARAHVKVKAESDGAVGVLYRDVLTAGPAITLCAQVNALDLNKPPKIGLSVDV